MTHTTRWYHIVFGSLFIAPLLLPLLVLLVVVGAMIPNLVVGLPLMLCGVTGWWLWIPSGIWAIPGITVACLFFWEEVLNQ